MNFSFSFLNNTIIQDITSKDSKNFHVNILGYNNITFTNFNISSPNTNGIHIGRSTQVNVKIVILGKYPNEEPVEGFTVRNCTLNNADNGVGIKIWSNTVTEMHFEDIKMVNVMNLIIIDQEYSSKDKISKVTFKNIIGTSATQEGVVLICSSGIPCEDVIVSDIDLTFNGTLQPPNLPMSNP
uniref:Polygalacturonase n=1 Tax=Cajanus cajan TaxID=3821 RepID=A0A151U9Y3_CAJCA|nr:Polygalacturonase [Cajanus cajan]